jgi:hypothetical protein
MILEMEDFDDCNHEGVANPAPAGVGLQVRNTPSLLLSMEL